jgi:hypothetical protein
MVTGQVVATNPAHAVRGPKHVVLQPEQASQGLDEPLPLGVRRGLASEVCGAPRVSEQDNYPKLRARVMFDDVFVGSRFAGDRDLVDDLGVGDNPREIGMHFPHISGDALAGCGPKPCKTMSRIYTATNVDSSSLIVPAILPCR